MSPPRPVPRTPGRIDPGLMLALGFVAMAGSLSTDVYLPAFPQIAAAFQVEASAVQLTMTAFLIGSAAGQLVIGAFSDALGRRRTLLAALAVFTACAYLAAVSPSVGVLIAIRAVQGFAGSAGAVLARAIVADLADRQQAVRAFSLLWAMIALGPAIAVPLGGWLAQTGGWRVTLLGVAVLATAMLLVASFVIPESLPPDRRHPFTFAAIGGNIGRLLRDSAFVGYAVAFGLGYGTLIVYISSSSFIVQNIFGTTPLGYSLTFSFTGLCIMSGAWLSGRVAQRVGTGRTLLVAQLLQLTAAGISGVLAVSGAFTLAWYLPLMGGFAVGCGAVMSTASAIAVGRAARTAGAGSALIGFSQFAFGAAASPLGGLLGTGTAVPALFFMTLLPLLAVGAAGAGRMLERRNPA
ncbi:MULTISPECIES: multidrug effflux MFS transporter [unclassified Microbacterium]|uniref:multidrug effflux MFS transporter n=1 Tax=unclassified Microbacterium TaxID=2609290 RepID=UPI00214D0F1F|nr:MULTISPECIES: multidrug effflux MFS transporter [unclassified Microbacterium]MCR2783251.1 multidrug effflux MFS transporter [Microbacterium sp. zg.B96]MDL5351965.1 multidrug effflux MFS transporter [Microbacterium sp. zg-YB36]WIM15874.1 multidrug effflux MFS transporter [Microbacterium sp. zg-B96]